MRELTARRLIICGWLLFIVSAGFFIAASLQAGDILALAGSLFFLVACFVFLIPILASKSEKSDG